MDKGHKAKLALLFECVAKGVLNVDQAADAAVMLAPAEPGKGTKRKAEDQSERLAFVCLDLICAFLRAY